MLGKQTLINLNSNTELGLSGGLNVNTPVNGLVGQKLTLESFFALSGKMAGCSFVKVVVDRPSSTIHFINDAKYKFHASYIADNLLKISEEELGQNIDRYNNSFYLQQDRRFFLGILAYHDRSEKSFFTLETVEIDNMDIEMLKSFFAIVRANVDQKYQLLMKPANHLQETNVRALAREHMPRIFNYELFAAYPYVALNEGKAKGRLRVMRSEGAYKQALASLEWYDIIAMDRVPEDIPRIAGIINAQHTTPLSHTNVLACGWQIPNAIQIGVVQKIDELGLDGQWVEYVVNTNDKEIILKKSTPPAEIMQKPTWSVQQVKLEEPDVVKTPIRNLDDLRMVDRFRYGTKAANLGELRHILNAGSDRLLGFYQIKRPPRENLINFIADFLGSEKTDPRSLAKDAWNYLKQNIEIPRGIAIPFSTQQEFLTSSPQIQQQIGKLKMALELGAREIDTLCLTLQRMIRGTRMPVSMRDKIDSRIVEHLGGVSSFVVRSSSNAEDLENFSAAGIYESINHVTTAENIFDSIKEVWASLVSPRSVRLRHQVGISLDDCYMGVIVQEEVTTEMGGVMVTMNPSNPSDFRNIFLNVSCQSVISVVQGAELPYQYLYNTVEGGGRTISIGNAKEDLDEKKKNTLQKLAFIGRILQSHFSKDYTFSAPQDIEWAVTGDHIFILQLRPYAK